MYVMNLLVNVKHMQYFNYMFLLVFIRNSKKFLVKMRQIKVINFRLMRLITKNKSLPNFTNLVRSIIKLSKLYKLKILPIIKQITLNIKPSVQGKFVIHFVIWLPKILLIGKLVKKFLIHLFAKFCFIINILVNFLKNHQTNLPIVFSLKPAKFYYFFLPISINLLKL